MDVNFKPFKVFNYNPKQQISIITHEFLNSLPKNIFQEVKLAIDIIGQMSSIAQELKSTITTTDKFLAVIDQKIFMKINESQILGFLKIGYKKLFIRNKVSQLHELNLLCVLDFYVHESQQRSGIGKQLFDFMLENEKTCPERLGYDRPSIKLLSFLKKYYGLTDYTKQNNNFVVYEDYFETKIKKDFQKKVVIEKDKPEIQLHNNSNNSKVDLLNRFRQHQLLLQMKVHNNNELESIRYKNQENNVTEKMDSLNLNSKFEKKNE